MRAQGAAPEGGTSGQRLISDGNGRNIEAKEPAMQGDVVPHVVAEINNEYRLARESASTAVEHAMRCGQLLLEQKALLKHGDFGPWIKKHLEFSQATANNYMKVAKNPNALGNSIRHLYRSGQPTPESKNVLPSAGLGDGGIDELRKALKSVRSPPQHRTKKGQRRAIERAVEKLKPLPDQQQILNHYQDCHKKLTRLRKALDRAEDDLFEAEDFLLWAAAQGQVGP